MTEMENNVISSFNKLFKTTSDNYIFIYTPPKVGSTTLVSSLRVSLGKTYNVTHLHDEVMLSVLTGINNTTIIEIINLLANEGKNVYVIDVYRTPIERKLSEFFEKISPYHFNNSESNINKYSTSRVSNRFNKLFPHLENGDHYFNKYNISEPIPFDFNKKYTVQTVNNIKFIKLRLCDSSLWGNILSNIFQTDIVLIKDYQTDVKEIGELYKRFNSEYKLPINYFEEIKNCRYLNFYYNEEEKNNYLRKWENRLCHEFNPYNDNEFKFYMNLCLENQYINDIQLHHYIDNGCFCQFCKNKRREIFFAAKRGETNFEKIIHTEVINELIIEEKKNHVQKIIGVINKQAAKKNLSKKFNINVFSK
jgi:hypothetical protein